MKLKVLAGAKKGAEIPLKRSKFVIGRASDCTLRAGSEAISRHHCVVLRHDSGVSIRDLGSRNGTFVNGEQIEGETPLANGDKVRVGPLEFIFEGAVDLAREKKPKVKDVAEALERTAQQSDSTILAEDDISRWLLGPAPETTEQSMRETQTIKLDETRAIPASPGLASNGEADNGQPVDAADAATVTDEDIAAELAEGEENPEDSGKKGGKKRPGKLPKIPKKPQAKDSREAAADILRELARRR